MILTSLEVGGRGNMSIMMEMYILYSEPGAFVCTMHMEISYEE